MKVEDASLYDGSTFFISPWSTGGSPMDVGESEWIQAEYPDLANGEFAENSLHLCYDAENGNWYIAEDLETKLYVMNEFELPEGSGYTIWATDDFKDEGGELTFSGQVKEGTTPISIDPYTYKMTGNVSPADKTIGDFLVDADEEFFENFDDSTFFVIIWNNGSPMDIGDSEWIQEKYPQLAEDCAAESLHLCWSPSDKKWYCSTDIYDKNYDMTNFPIKAGEAVSIWATDDFGEDPLVVELPGAL